MAFLNFFYPEIKIPGHQIKEKKDETIVYVFRKNKSEGEIKINKK